MGWVPSSVAGSHECFEQGSALPCFGHDLVAAAGAELRMLVVQVYPLATQTTFAALCRTLFVGRKLREGAGGRAPVLTGSCPVPLPQVKPHLEDRHTIVSIAAGITLQSLKASSAATRLRGAAHCFVQYHPTSCTAISLFCPAPAVPTPCPYLLTTLPGPRLPPPWLQAAAGDNVRLVRVMPNTPCLVGETAAAM